MTDEEVRPLSWTMWTMDWEWPPSWRFIKRAKFKARLKRIVLLEVQLEIIPEDMRGHVPGWIYWWYNDPGDYF